MRVSLIILFLLNVTLSIGQKVFVFDKNNLPIENVIVIGDDFNSHTNKNGELIYFPESGTSQIAFIHPNYKRLTLNWNQLVEKNFRIALEQRVRQIEEVTIRPFKRAQMLSDIPQEVAVVTPSDALIFQPQTTADLLASSGEVFIQKSQMGGGSPMIRGFSANRIMLVVDGVRMNNAIYRSGNLHNVISLDATSLEQTEIIMGPSSVIYGSDALGGVIHFHTLKPRLSTSEIKTPVSAMFRTSSANFEKTGHINFNLASKKWASMTSASFSDFNHLRMGSWNHNEYTRNEYVESLNGIDQLISNSNPNRQIYSGYSQMNFIQKLRYRPSDVADFEYAFHFSRTSDIPRYDRLIQYNEGTPKYADWYYGPQQWMMHVVKAELSLDNQFANTISIIGAIQDYSESRHDRKFNSTSLRHRAEDVDIYSINIDADKYISKTQSMYYGMEGIFNKVGSNGYATDTQTGEKEFVATRYPDGSEWWSWAAYLMYNQMLSAQTSLQAGVRYNLSGMNGTFDNTFYNFPFDDFKDSNGALSVNFGFVFTPSDELRINTNVSTGFRAPNIDDVAKVFDSEPGNVIIPNPNLDPEYASSFEVGFHWQISEKVNLELSTFYTRLYNAMVRKDGTLNGQDSILYDGEMSKVQMLTNASWANLGGLSSHIYYKISDQLETNANINWQAGLDSDNLPLRHIAPLFGDVHFIYQKKKWKIDGYVLFNGQISYEKLAQDERAKTHIYASDVDGNPYAPAWWTLNLKSTYQLNKTVNLNAGVENIMDVRYRPYSSGIVAPGINVSFSVGIRL